jgi:hypothetical protein
MPSMVDNDTGAQVRLHKWHIGYAFRKNSSRLWSFTQCQSVITIDRNHISATRLGIPVVVLCFL